jgi:pterin-4a-carbinolamine dehydratase
MPTLFPGKDAHEIIVEAVDCFAIVASEPLESIKGWCLESARLLYRKSVEVGDYSAALACVKEVARLAAMKT